MVQITHFLSGNAWYVYLFIFLGKLIEVALATLRSQLIHKGQRMAGALTAIFEYIFWLSITASALSGFQSYPYKLLVLILAFASGQVLGSWIEERLALGYSTVTSFYSSHKKAMLAADILREHGFALTLLPSLGMDEKVRYTMITSLKRNDVNHVKKLLYDAIPDVVLTVSATQSIHGYEKFLFKK